MQNRPIFHINHNGLLYEYQFGFWKDEFTHMALITFIDFWSCGSRWAGHSYISWFLKGRRHRGSWHSSLGKGWKAKCCKDQFLAHYSFYYTLMTRPHCRQPASLFCLLMTSTYVCQAKILQSMSMALSEQLTALYEYHGFDVTNSHWILLSSRQNSRHFPDDIFKYIFLNENAWILMKISLEFVPKGPINNIPALVQMMAWRRPGDKPLSEPMIVSLRTHICVTRPQWVKTYHMHFTPRNKTVNYISMYIHNVPIGRVMWANSLVYKLVYNWTDKIT